MKTNAIDNFLCTDLWTSEINGGNDGLIAIEFGPDPVSGLFTGSHVLPTFEIRGVNGKCTHPGPGQSDHVFEFYETARSGERYYYSGVVVPDASAAHRHRIPNGKRRRLFFNLEENRKEMLDDDEWVGTHTT